VVLSWTFTHTVFTLHYANVYYRPDEDGRAVCIPRRSRARLSRLSSIIPSSSAALRRPVTSHTSRAMRHLT
jgi:hypothetical protein